MKSNNEIFLFQRIAWMSQYQGVTEDDQPSGAGKYVLINNDGGEVCNFLRVGRHCYGFSRMPGNRSTRIQRLGASKSDDSISNVTIVFFAKHPYGGQYVVGWYKNATLFRRRQTLKKGQRLDHLYYNSVTLAKDATLIDADARIFEVPDKSSGGPGQANTWYVMEYAKSSPYLRDLTAYISDHKGWTLRHSKKGRLGPAFQKDAELRKQVEIAAMERVEEHFMTHGFDVSKVHTENLGWDLEATRGSVQFQLEVKGLSGEAGGILLTPNEFQKSRTNRRTFRLCVVSMALDQKRQKLEIFQYNGAHFISTAGKVLKVEKRTGALLHFEPTRK